MLLNIGDKPVQIVSAGDPPTLLVNRDLSSQILTGPDSGLTGGNVNVYDVIDPLGSVLCDGAVDVWAMRAPGSTTVPAANVMPHKQQWTPSPQQIAAQISLSGVYSLNRSTVINSGNGVVAPASSGGNLCLNSAINQVGYEIWLRVRTTTAAAPLMGFTFQWSDSVTNQIVSTETFEFYGGGSTNGTSHIVAGRGPTRADVLTVAWFNNDATNNASFDFVLSQNSRTYSSDLWQSQQINTIPGFTLASYLPSNGYLMSYGASVTAATDVPLMMPFYTAPMQVRFRTASGGTDARIRFFAPSGTFVGADTNFFNQVTQAGGDLFTPSVVMPPMQCIAHLTNNNAAAQTLDLDIISTQLQ